MTLQTPHLLAPGEGSHYDFLSNCFTVKVGARETGGVLTAIEFTGPPGFAPPPHRHDIEDELFYVLEGEVAFWVGDEQVTTGPGGFVWAPKGIPHRFAISEDGPARVFQITSPPQFEDFVAAIGQPMARHELPEPTEPDVERLVEVAKEFQIEILGAPQDA